MQLGSCVAVAIGLGSCSSNWTSTVGTSMCHGYGPKKTKRKKERKEGRKEGRTDKRTKERKKEKEEEEEEGKEKQAREKRD